MIKNPAWQNSLNNFVKQSKKVPFQWGQHDCCMFFADAIKATTGEDPAKAFRGKYSSAIGSVRALKRHGQGNLKDTLLSIFGEPIPRLQATRGDVVYFTTDQGEAAGIVFGAGIISTGENGIVNIELSRGLIFWSVEKWR
jgi:hypothetical protein